MDIFSTALDLDFSKGDSFFQTTYIRKSSGDSPKEIVFSQSCSAEGSFQRNWVKEYLSDNKESLYIVALQNLKRMFNYAQLNIALLREDISDEEFDKELECNEDKYLIPAPVKKASLQQIAQTSDIVKRVGFMKDSSVDDISDLFSLDFSDTLQTIENKKILAK